jgi:outer membrane receptor protein involved in Fe transport
MTRVLAILALFLAVAFPTSAQETAGTVSGTVVDETGGILPGATVTLSGAGTSKTHVSGSDGGYSFASVAPGSYKLTVTLSGFSSATQDVTVGGAGVEVPAVTLKLAGLGETIVVSASKVESTITNAPATMTVITAETLQSSPSQNFGDLLRSVPGLNVIQMSARDVNLASRKTTGTLETSQLVLLDGRTIYLDFFGLVLWDLVPSNTGDIKQIEVVRGPASAVWGANALAGVVNIITKTPREAVGSSVTLSGGTFNRDGGSRESQGEGRTFGVGVSIARAPNEKFSYRLAGGYYHSDPYSRPVGRIPVIADPRVSSPVCNTATGVGADCVGGAPYPIDGTGAFGTAFENDGTKQPKVDLRVDQELGNGGRMTYDAGYAGSTGFVHTGIGPFDIRSGSYMAYGKIGYSRDALKVTAFVNLLDVKAPNLLNLNAETLRPLELNFKTQTYDFEIGHSKALGGRHILSYGGNARRNNFKISITPTVKDRNEFGAYFQEEFFVDKFRLTAGARVDKFGNIKDPAFSPRVTAMFKPAQDHSIRVSFNKAFRSPSAVNNFLDTDIFAPSFVDLRPLAPFAPPALQPALAQPFRPRIRIAGGEVVSPRYELKKESLTAYEVSYTGTFRSKTTVGLALYQNDSNDNLNFVFIVPSARRPQGLPGFDVLTPANAPAVVGLNQSGQPVPGALVTFLAALPPPFGPIFLPRTAATYLNLGPLRQRGFEVSLDHRLGRGWSASANYSYQGKPKPLTPDAGQLEYLSEEVALPPTNRFNASVSWNDKRFVGTASVNYADKAFWSDVLNAPFHGFTDSYTMLNATFGVKWADGKMVTSLKGTNLANQKIQQHIFGDILKRSVLLEARFIF